MDDLEMKVYMKMCSSCPNSKLCHEDANTCLEFQLELELEQSDAYLGKRTLPWIVQQGSSSEPDFIGWAPTHADALKLLNPDGVTESTFISVLDDLDIYLDIRDRIELDDVVKLDKLFGYKEVK